jgi:hypothetical protein
MPNRMRWDGRTRQFYEVWYFIVQRPEERDAFWIRYTLLNPPDEHPAAGAGLWFAHASRQDPAASLALSQTFPQSALQARPGELDLTIAGSRLSEGRLRGGFSAKGHTVAWDLTYEPEREVDYFFGGLLRRLMESKTSVTIPHPRARFKGRVTIDGREHLITGAPGHEAHHWGREKAASWRWAHCAAFAGAPGALLEALSADKPPLPRLTFLRVVTATETLDLSSLPHAIWGRSEARMGSWRFSGGDPLRKVEVELFSPPECVVRFLYHSPRYERSHCYHSPVADARVRIYRRSVPFGAWRLAGELCAEGTANAEVVVPVERDPFAADFAASRPT